MYSYGKNVAREVLHGDQRIITAYLVKNFNEMEILELLKKSHCDIEYVDKFRLDKMVDGLHQGIVLKVPDYEYHDLDEFTNKENAFVVILDHLEDPHNFGAILRTSEAAGVDGIIIPKDRSVEVNGTVMKVSVGTLEKVPVARVTNINDTIEKLKKRGFWIVGTDMNGDDYTKIDYQGKTAIVVGNEGNGISSLVARNCDFMASIPMVGDVNSLNASVATGIILFEAVKQRR